MALGIGERISLSLGLCHLEHCFNIHGLRDVNYAITRARRRYDTLLTGVRVGSHTRGVFGKRMGTRSFCLHPGHLTFTELDGFFEKGRQKKKEKRNSVRQFYFPPFLPLF